MRYAALLLAAGCATAPAGPDLGLSDLRVTETVVVGGQVDVHVRVVLRQMEARELELELAVETRDGRAVATERQTVRLPGAGSHAFAATLKSPPVGEYRLAVRAPALAEEADGDNNAVSAPFAVRPREPRVLYIEHPPRYEYRFLKNALIRDRSLLAHMWLTSADDGFPQECSQAGDDPRFRAPLKAMPKTLEALLGYDVVIVGDVDADKLPVEALRAFVEEHGRGLVVISGVMNAPQGWKGTALAGLLPVDGAGRMEEPAELPSRYRLTASGKAGTLTRFPSLGGDADRNEELWCDRDERGDGLVGVRWFARVRAKKGADVLVEASASGGWAPLFVAWKAGRGRVFFSATDETWLWRYLVGDEPWFYPFWRGVVSWAAGE